MERTSLEHTYCSYENLVVGNVIHAPGIGWYRISRRTTHNVWGRRLARILGMDVHLFKPYNDRTLTTCGFHCSSNNPLSDGQEDRLAKRGYDVYRTENIPYLYFGYESDDDRYAPTQEKIDSLQGGNVPRHLIPAAFVNRQTLEAMDRPLPNGLPPPRVAVNMREANEEAERYHARQEAFVPEQPPNA